MLKHMLKQISLFLSVLAFCSLSAAYAKSTGMPYEGVLSELSESLTGPVAKAIALIGIVGSGAALIFGGEISGFLKSVIYLVLVCSILIVGSTIVGKFTSTGYEITQETIITTPNTSNSTYVLIAE